MRGMTSPSLSSKAYRQREATVGRSELTNYKAHDARVGIA